MSFECGGKNDKASGLQFVASLQLVVPNGGVCSKRVRNKARLSRTTNDHSSIKKGGEQSDQKVQPVASVVEV